MSLVGSVSLTNNDNGLYLGKINIDNLNSDTNSVLYSVNGSDIKGDNNILKFEEDIKKLTVSESMSYVSAYPIGVETANNDNNFFTGVLAQNKNSSDGSSAHLLLTNDLGTDSAFYGGFDMFSSNSTIQYGQFGTMPNALGISSQSSSIVLTPNAGNNEGSVQNNNIMLTYSGGTKAHIINNNGQLIIGADNPSFAGNTYGGDDGGVNKVLTSDGVNGLKWSSPTLYFVDSYSNQYPSTLSGNPLTIFSKVGQLGVIPQKPTIMMFSLNILVAGGTDVLTLTLKNGSDVITSLNFNVGGGAHTVAGQFNFEMPNEYILDYSIVGSLVTHNITINTSSAYGITIYQNLA